MNDVLPFLHIIRTKKKELLFSLVYWCYAASCPFTSIVQSIKSLLEGERSVSAVNVSVLLSWQSRLTARSILKWFSNETRHSGRFCQLTLDFDLRHVDRKKHIYSYVDHHDDPEGFKDEKYELSLLLLVSFIILVICTQLGKLNVNQYEHGVAFVGHGQTV